MEEFSVALNIAIAFWSAMISTAVVLNVVISNTFNSEDGFKPVLMWVNTMFVIYCVYRIALCIFAPGYAL